MTPQFFHVIINCTLFWYNERNSTDGRTGIHTFQFANFWTRTIYNMVNATLQYTFQSNSNKRTNLGTNGLRSFRREWTLKFAQKHALHFFTSTGNACSLVVNISWNGISFVFHMSHEKHPFLTWYQSQSVVCAHCSTDNRTKRAGSYKFN